MFNKKIRSKEFFYKININPIFVERIELGDRKTDLRGIPINEIKTILKDSNIVIVSKNDACEPMLFSTGKANMEDLAAAIDTLEAMVKISSTSTV